MTRYTVATILPTSSNLIPEKALLAGLAPHIQRRFKRALVLMHDSLAQQLTWEQIAWQSAISPAHFHRQFKDVFYETPGSYLSRLRLKFATEQLLCSPQKSITDIAQLAGFSDSQALAKALKRRLGVTAKAIKQMADKATPEQTAAFMARLSQPFDLGKLEYRLAQQISAELIWVVQRSAQTLVVDAVDWHALLEKFNMDSTRLLVLTPVSQLQLGWQQIDVVVSNWQVDVALHDLVVKEGYYLSTVVTLDSAIAYFAAFEALFDIAQQRGLTVDLSGLVTEQLLDYCEEEGATFLFQIPVMD